MLTREHLLQLEGWVIDRNPIQRDARCLIQSQLKSIERLPVSSMGLDQTPEKDLLSKVYSAYRYWATFRSEGSLKSSRFITLSPPCEIKRLQTKLCPIYPNCQIWLTSSKGKITCLWQQRQTRIHFKVSKDYTKKKCQTAYVFLGFFLTAASQNDSFLRREKATSVSKRTKENLGNEIKKRE